ncbi:T9SS type A sorting domain-containing protein [Kaistella flava (ex Peng et al. 2021)]|uniref:T9SS type A sorting domain-containing protein n=1 Tax=Kaistella flava (ex Peng et al. 2021) TaxID=2038776 RepID=A0A7M2YAZ1_9FLAO|nr:T9SS type A sorting domain-containing protein [Kaistella flava (ex Peng et al. 2021)]QOW10582.1 T9SS type A sorting domain-containing protein [Kaistella flava (ex Peng et al. 2021)]
MNQNYFTFKNSWILLLLFISSFSSGATYYSRASGNWDARATWSTTSGGGQVGTGVFPKTGDTVIIERGYTVTVNVTNAACGSLQLGGTATNNGGILTFSGTSSALTVSGDIRLGAAGNVNRTGKITFAGTTPVLTAGSLILGNSGATPASGTVTMSAGSILNVGSLTVNTVTGNTWTPSTGTVVMTANNTLPTTIFTLFNNLSVSGGTTTTTANLVIGGNLDVGDGASFTTGNNFTLGVTGTTGVIGTLVLGGTGTKTFTGNVTIDTSGTWNEIGNAAINYAGNLTNNNVFTTNSGLHTFSGTGKIISGSAEIAIPNVTIGVTTTNSGTLTINTALSGAGTLTNAATGILNIGGTSGITTLTATAAGNTVNYNGAAQTVKATGYSNLTLSGSGTKTFGANTAVNGNWSMLSGVVANLGTGFTHSAATLTLGGAGTINGSWGGTGYGGNINTTYFTNATGKISVGTASCTAGAWTGYTSTDWNTASNWCSGAVPTAGTNVVIPAGVSHMPTITNVNAVANNVTINDDATLTLSNSATSFLNIKGDFINNGILTAGLLSTVTFDGTAAASVIGGTKTSAFGNLAINRSTGNSTVTNSSNAFSVTGNLTVTKGDLVLSNTVDSYLFGGNLMVATEGILTHNVSWDGYGRQIVVSGNLDISGAYVNSGAITAKYPKPRSHLGMNGVDKTINTGTSALSILTLTNTSGSILANGTMTVNDNFWSSFNMDGGTFVIPVNSTVNANDAVFNSGGTLLINGGTLNVKGTLYAGFGEKNGTVNFSSGVLNADGLNVGFGSLVGTFNHTGGIANIGEFIITNASTYTCTGTPIINISGNWNNSKTFTAGNSKVNFVGTAAQTIDGILSGANGKFFNLTFNGAGATNNAPIDVAGTLTMTKGILNASAANFVNITNTAVTGATGGSATSFVNGPVKWATTLANAYAFPVGKGANYLPFILKNTTAPTVGATVTAEAFSADSAGKADLSSVSALSTTEYWSIVTAGTFSNSSVSLSRPTAISPLDIVAGSIAANGTYASLGGTPGGNGINNSAAFGNNRFFAFGRQKQKIATGSITGFPFCAGSSVSVPFTIVGTFDSGNIFTAQLSNASGSFTTPVSIGTLTQTSAGTISATIPARTLAGTKYRIRVVSSNPIVTGSDNGIDLTINNVPTIAVISAPAALCSGGSLNPTAPTVTANGSTVTSQGWQIETAVGSGVFGALTVPYTVAFADNGKKIRYIATNGCGTTNGNEVTLTVNNVPTIATISAPAALCSGGSLNPTAPTVTANGSTVTSQGWQIETAVGSGVFGAFTVPYTIAFADNGKKIRYIATNSCGTTNGNQVTLTVNNVPTIAVISAPAALCSGGSLNPTAPTVTANGSTVTSQGWQIETAVGSGVFGALTVPYIIAFADNGKKIRYIATNGCGTTNGNEVTLKVNNVPTIAAISAPAALCSGGSLSPTAPTLTANGSTVTSQGWQIETTVGTGVFGALTVPYTIAFADNGKKIRYVATNGCGTTNGNEVTLAVNPNLPVSVIISANPGTTICSGTSVTFTATPTNGGTAPAYQWKVNGTDMPGATSSTYTTTTLADGAKVTVVMTSKASPCSIGSPSTSEPITMTLNDGAPTTYNGGINWSNGLPDSTKKVIFAADYSTEDGESLTACSCQVNTGVTLTVIPKSAVTIQNDIINNGKILVQSDGDLIQVNDQDSNSGTGIFTVERISPMKRLDYTYWSSPVKGQIFQKFSPSTVSTRFLEYHENDDIFYPVTWTKEFEIAKGYAIRAPNNFTDARKDFIGPFIGAPNNGVQNFSLASSHTDGGYNLVGNPYASNIDFEKLYSLNSDKIDKIAYFWTNINLTPPVQQGSAYSGNNYAIFSGTGGVGAASSVGGESIEPTQFIKVGQGFIIKAKSTANAQLLVFNNSIRSDSNDSNFFSKGNASAKDRYWLKLTTPALNVNTILIGYVPHATNSFELDYDAPLMTIGSDSFYSILDQNRLGIQGRQYPLNTLDVVQLGSNQYESGNYTISLDKKEGIFANGQNIYLKDHQAGTLTNISEGSYTFAANAGLTDGRFEIVYQNNLVLETGSTTKDPLIVYRDGNDFIVKSSTKVISEVEVYDTSGRLLLKVKPDHKETRIEASNLVNGIYVLKIKRDGSVVTKKIMR